MTPQEADPPTLRDSWLARFLAASIDYEPPPSDQWDMRAGYPRDERGRKWESTKEAER